MGATQRKRQRPFLARDAAALPTLSEASWDQAILSWKSELPERRTTSPWTKELLIHRIGRELMRAGSAESIAECVDIAPWHPLGPVSLGRFEQDPTRQRCLAALPFSGSEQRTNRSTVGTSWSGTVQPGQIG